ncbi:MAG TPA: hypothetical protein VHW73_01140 [Rudaea sp.]|jgi:hypothetical protein|nr:hypothetical protein [Rudaea sp.]
MRLRLFVLTVIALAGCDSFNATRPSPHGGTVPATGELVLTGEFDNREQGQVGGGVAVPHIVEMLRIVQNNRNGHLWLWRLQSNDTHTTTDAAWLYRIVSADDGAHITFTPFRALDDAANKSLRDAKQDDFKFDEKQWAELAPCAMKGERKNGVLVVAADNAACSALLPGLGAAAGLLPLKLMFDGEMLTSVTFADQARGADASIEARRVRWFGGWSAINGAGPKAKVDSKDWHTRQDLRIGSEGGKIPIRWRDGAPSGYSIELVRRTYPERKLSVLQLDVVEDSDGRVIDYAWADPSTAVIGINLGWLQVGLTVEK